jgi:hypothetical protein
MTRPMARPSYLDNLGVGAENHAMPHPLIREIFFLPPMAIARVGSSETPLDAFSWGEDQRFFGAGRTVVVPQISLEVLADGSLRPYLPRHIRFKDPSGIRPVCPFVELHALCEEHGKEELVELPLTPGLLGENGLDVSCLSFKVHAANRKAARRTGDKACAFEARRWIKGNDHRRHRLDGYTRSQTGRALVLREHAIPLGMFQVIRPAEDNKSFLGINLDTIRVRFTPAQGKVYGPPSAISEQPANGRGEHIIVPPENRILNPEANWCNFVEVDAEVPVSPKRTFDAEDPDNKSGISWGVVDDTCDALITATLTGGHRTLTAIARVFVGPPHYAPDRRPFYSMVDELADRDPASVAPTPQPELDEVEHAVFDLFRRIFETASMMNIERQRNVEIDFNRAQTDFAEVEAYPRIFEGTMQPEDKINGEDLLSPLAKSYLEDAPVKDAPALALPRWELAQEQHAEMANLEYLIWFLAQSPDRLRNIIRPPFAWLRELHEEPRKHDPRDLRDPRIPRDRAHDMRMPPYMRDSDFSALSLTRRQWELIREYAGILHKQYSAEGKPSERSEAERHSNQVQGRLRKYRR